MAAAATYNIIAQMVLTVCNMLQAVSLDSVCSQCGSPVLAASSAPVTAGLHQSSNHCRFSAYAGLPPVLESLALLHDAVQCLCPIRHGLSPSMHSSCNAQMFTNWRPGFDCLSYAQQKALQCLSCVYCCTNVSRLVHSCPCLENCTRSASPLPNTTADHKLLHDICLPTSVCTQIVGQICRCGPWRCSSPLIHTCYGVLQDF